MAIKDLFLNKSSYKVLSSTELDKVMLDVESSENMDQKIVDKNRFIPPVDFSSASNFAKYGSAEEYYDSSIKRIYKQYPYDGSEREIQEFLNDSTYLDLHILENLYPRSTGYARKHFRWIWSAHHKRIYSG